jgi:hypothetical protein
MNLVGKAFLTLIGVSVVTMGVMAVPISPAKAPASSYTAEPAKATGIGNNASNQQLVPGAHMRTLLDSRIDAQMEVLLRKRN